MTDEKWQDLIAEIKTKYKIEEEKAGVPIEEGRGTIDFIVFCGPQGRIKLERVIRPVVIDKKTFGSKRIGSEARVEYVYSPTEKIQKLKAYRWDEQNQNWQDIQSAF